MHFECHSNEAENPSGKFFLFMFAKAFISNFIYACCHGYIPTWLHNTD